MISVTAIHRDGVSLELESKQVDALKAALRGTLLRSGDDGYADARSICNGGGILPAPISCNCPSLQRKQVKASNVLTRAMNHQKDLP